MAVAEVLAGFHAGPPRTERPVALVHGNCQAESLRRLLGDEDLLHVRLPPVHEMTRSDVPPLLRWLERADVFVSQPIRDGYRGLPIGTRELARATRARLVVVPVVRSARLYPAQAIIRPPSDPSLVPPVVPYHDLRTLAAAARLRGRAELSPTAVRAVADASLGELRARERRHGAVVVSDLLAEDGFAAMRTINHPGNAVLAGLARRVREAAGLDGGVADPGRPLLDAVHAPREAAVVAALGLDDEPREHWLVDGAPVATEAVREAHLRWYEDHPDAVAAGLQRHAATLAALGLAR